MIVLIIQFENWLLCHRSQKEVKHFPVSLSYVPWRLAALLLQPRKKKFKRASRFMSLHLEIWSYIMIHLDVVDYDPCQKSHIVLTNLKHTSNKYFSTFSEYLLLFQKIWFDLISGYWKLTTDWLLYCPMYYSGISIGPGSCLVIHITFEFEQ